MVCQLMILVKLFAVCPMFNFRIQFMRTILSVAPPPRRLMCKTTGPPGRADSDPLPGIQPSAAPPFFNTIYAKPDFPGETPPFPLFSALERRKIAYGSASLRKPDTIIARLEWHKQVFSEIFTKRSRALPSFPLFSAGDRDFSPPPHSFCKK